MKVTAKGGPLADELVRASRVTAKKETIPALQYALVEAEPMAASITVTATDLDVSIRTTVPAAVESGGSVLVHARRIAELSRLFRADDDVLLDDTGKSVRVASGAYDGKLMTLPASEYPSLPWPPAEGGLVLSRLLPAQVAQVDYAISEHDQRYNTAGALLAIGDGLVTLVGTDGHRMAISSVPCETPTTATAIIARKALPELRAMLDGTEAPTFFATDNHLFFTAGGRTLATRVLEGKFPAWERIVPAGLDKSATIDRDAFIAAVKRVSLVAETVSARTVKLALGAGAVRVSALGADVGEADEPVPADLAGGDVSIAVNGAYLAQFLAAAVAGPILMELVSDVRAVVFTQSTGEATYRYVLMPVRA